MKYLIFLICLASCAHSSQPKEQLMHYPSHWWAPVPESERASWEILPQAAKLEKGEVILSKRNELGLLSNFAATPFTFRGKRYASLEGFWQMMKYPEGKNDPRNVKGVHWKHSREEVSKMTAFEAHSAGVEAEENMKRLGVDWITFEGEKIRYKGDGIDRHYEIIRAAMETKVAQNPKVKEVLLSTGSLVLRPDHFEDADGTKTWRYYEIYMGIRSGLQAKR